MNMNKSAVLKKYKQINKDLEGQRSNLKQSVSELATKNIEETKTNEDSFYSNKQKAFENTNRIKSALIEKKRLLEESNISTDNVFLFSEAPRKETYNLQLQILKAVSSGLKTVQTIKERAEAEETFAENRRKKLDEFSLFVKQKEIKKIKDKSKILSDIFVAEEDYCNDLFELSSIANSSEKDKLSAKNEIDKVKLMKDIKAKLMPLYRDAFKNVENWNDTKGFVTFIVGITYRRCKKLSEVFNKYGIENYIISNNVKDIVDNNDNNENVNVIYEKRFFKTVEIRNAAKKSIEKEYKVKKVFRNLLLFLAIALIVFCVPNMHVIEETIANNEFLNQYADVIMTAIYPTMLGFLVFTIILRGMLNTEKKYELEKCHKYCNVLCAEYFKKYYKLLAELSNEYYELCKTDHFEKSERMIKEMLQFKAIFEEESEKVRQLLVDCFKNSMPNGLIENELLIDTIVKAMEEGRATEYKEARTIAESIIEKEQIMRQQTEYLVDKARKDDEHRRAVMNSQLRMEKHAEEQAEAARRSAEAASRAAAAQEKAATYAKDAAESSQKLLDLEEKKRWEEVSKG